MAWPKGKPRKRVEEPWQAPNDAIVETPVIEEPPAPQESQYPSDWRPGMLLNVRNTGADYTITLYPEEYDPRHPERALHFTNPGEAQNFVSKWYARESYHPLAR